ncbi:hypothetical protein MRX96_042319 [Rhipicephalus microplus]
MNEGPREFPFLRITGEMDDDAPYFRKTIEAVDLPKRHVVPAAVYPEMPLRQRRPSCRPRVYGLDPTSRMSVSAGLPRSYILENASAPSCACRRGS